METAIRLSLETLLLAINLRDAEGLHSSRGKLRLRVKTQVSVVCISHQALVRVTLSDYHGPILQAHLETPLMG